MSAAIPSQPAIIAMPLAPGEEDAALATLGCVLAHSAEDCHVLVLAIGEVMLDKACSTLSDGRVGVIRVQADRRGALATALRWAADCFPGRDVLLIRAGVLPPVAWDRRLAAVVDRQPNAATVSPVSQRLLHRLGPAVGSDEAIDRWLYAVGNRLSLEVPQPLEECFYIRGAVLAKTLGQLVETTKPEQPFFARLARQVQFNGYCHAVVDHIWVGRHEAGSDTGPALRLDGPHAELTPPHYLATLGYRVQEASQSPWPPQSIPVATRRPVQLHVMHSWGGGLGRWVEDYCRADQQRENFVLRHIGDPHVFAYQLVLYRHVDDAEPIRRWILDTPIVSTAIAHLQYEQILQEIVETYGVEGILVSSLVGHSLDVLRTSVPTAVVCHDYYPFCPAFNVCFGGVCESCDRQRMDECFAGNPYNRFVRSRGTDYSIALRERYVETIVSRGVSMVVPSPSVRENLLRLEPRLRRVSFHVIPHGVNQAACQDQPPTPVTPRKPRAVVLGRLSAEKGADILAEALPQLTDMIDVALIGCGERGERLGKRPGVSVVLNYSLPDLPATLQALAPDFGLLLSMIPETFSYTLSELSHCGIPVLATRIGSFADRIEDGANGFLIEPSAAALVDGVRKLVQEPARLATVRENLTRYPRRSVADMVADYHALLPMPVFAAEWYLRGGESAAADNRAATLVEPPPQTPSPGGLWERIAAEETFSTILERVYHVARLKLLNSPRLREWQRPIVRVMLAGSWRAVQVGQRIIRLHKPRREAA